MVRSRSAVQPGRLPIEEGRSVNQTLRGWQTLHGWQTLRGWQGQHGRQTRRGS